jgi:hypothetical protein
MLSRAARDRYPDMIACAADWQRAEEAIARAENVGSPPPPLSFEDRTEVDEEADTELEIRRRSDRPTRPAWSAQELDRLRTIKRASDGRGGA